MRSQFLLLVVLLLYTALEPEAFSQDRTNVKIGLIYPLTGPMSSFGEDIARAVPLLEKKFNTKQSKYQFQLILEDGKFGQGNAAITAAKKLVETDGVRFLVVGSSGETLQVAQYVESKHILTVTGFSSHPGIKDAGDYIFRTYIDIESGIKKILGDVVSKKFQRVAVLTELSSFTAAVKDTLESGLGSRLAYSGEYSLGDGDINAIVTKARSRQPDAYYLNTTAPASFVTLVKALRGSGEDKIFYTYYVPGTKEVREGLDPKLFKIRYLDFPAILDASPDFSEFLAEFEKSTAGTVNALFNFRTNYNAIKVIFDAILAVGPDTMRAKNFLYKYDSTSATGRLRFDRNGDAINLNLDLKDFRTS